MKKKDLNYIAAVEKSISKKYGDIAIQNPAKFWDEDKEKDYIKQLEDFVEKQKKYEHAVRPENVDGILITRKLLNKESVLNCPVCGHSIKCVNDDIYVIKYECCEKCYIKYIEGREARWLSGWRPENVTESN